MKNSIYYLKVAVLLTSILFFGCSEDSINEEIFEIESKQKYPPLPENSRLTVEILAHTDAQGNIDGYFFVDDPATVFAVSQSSDAVALKVASSSHELVSLVGDQDNFGYGTSHSAPPCRTFNLSSAEDDLGNFDRLINGDIDSEKTWSHNFTSDSGYCPQFEIEEVVIEVREYFVNDAETVKIMIDGYEYDFPQNGISRCFGKVLIQAFTFTGEDAAFAKDGEIEVSILENGDEIAIDYSLATIKYSTPDTSSSSIFVGSCNTHVADALIGCDYMSESIEDIMTSSKNHGQFVNAVAKLTDTWINEGRINNEEKGAIMSCVGKSNLP